MADNPNLEAVIAAARKGVAPVNLLEGDHWLEVFLPVGPDGEGKVVTVDGERRLPRPARKRGTVEVFDVASFNQVIADNADAGDAAIYLDRDPEKPVVEAVLNGNGRGGAGWADFRVRLVFRPTPQWRKWREIDGKLLPQVAFAEFVEDNLADIADPPGATMLEIVTFLQATRSVDFKSGIRLGSGQVQFQNLESIDAKVGAGLIAVPEAFTLALAPLLGAPIYRVPARFRYRVQDGKLQLGLKLQRVEDLMGQLIEDVVAKIERGANITVLDGTAPQPTR